MKNIHGANLFEISRKNNVEIDKIMDFSSNINPLSPSPKAFEFLKKNLSLIKTYPDPLYKNLKEAISKYSSCATDNIILGLGSTELLTNAINLINPKKALILSPSYSEYENELNKINAEIFFYTLKLENNFRIDLDEIINLINKNNIELFVFANPNNPTGSILKKDQIEEILKKTCAYIIVDETYIEFTDMKIFSSVGLIKNYNKIIISRGTSKFFGVPGLRLGYALNSQKDLLNKFTNKEILWQINICADLMGQVMFKDKEYIENAFSYIKEQREKLMSELENIPSLKAVNSSGNFILVKLKKGSVKSLVKKLRENLIIVRDCSDFKGLDESYFRFCILDKKSNEIFIEKLRDALK